MEPPETAAERLKVRDPARATDFLYHPVLCNFQNLYSQAEDAGWERDLAAPNTVQCL